MSDEQPPKSIQQPNKRKFASDSQTSESDAPVTKIRAPLSARLASFKTRLITTFIMIFGFLLIIAAGHLYCCLLVLFINICIFYEIISLKRNEHRDQKLPFFFIINWYFFALTEVFVTATFLKDRGFLQENDYVAFLYNYSFLLSFILYVIGICLFVMSLKKGQYRYQFRIFGWTHITCLLVVTQSTTIIINIYNGLIWFLLPASLVIVNDCFAYLFGVFLGRTPLIKISPNKTWEGFIGGLFSTILWAYIFSHFLAQFEYMVCPQNSFTLSPFTSLTCNSGELLVRKVRELPWIFSYVGLPYINATSLEFHSMVLGFFAGFIAPFGGFFASGVKRAFKIKDFGNSIPGHGGMTDRMDCQLMMGMFTCVWVQSIVIRQAPTVAHLMAQVLKMNEEQQLELLLQLKNKLSH